NASEQIRHRAPELLTRLTERLAAEVDLQRRSDSGTLHSGENGVQIGPVCIGRKPKGQSRKSFWFFFCSTLPDSVQLPCTALQRISRCPLPFIRLIGGNRA